MNATSANLKLLERIEANEVDPRNISTSQSIMAGLAFDRPDWMPHGWADLTEKEQLDRLDEAQIMAINQFKQTKLD